LTSRRLNVPKTPANGLWLTCGGALSNQQDAVAAVSCSRLLDSRPRCYIHCVTFTIELEPEDNGRWVAEVPALAGVMCYGKDRDDAIARVQALALRVIADRLEHGEAPTAFLNVTFQAA